MNLPIIVTCDCFSTYDAQLVAGETKEGTPRLHFSVKPCQTCIDKAVGLAIEEYQADQMAHHVDKVMDERRGN